MHPGQKNRSCSFLAGDPKPREQSNVKGATSFAVVPMGDGATCKVCPASQNPSIVNAGVARSPGLGFDGCIKSKSSIKKPL